MLEEMQGAGLGWDHPFVQCRIQGALFSMRKNTPLPPNLCANLAPDPEILDPQSPLAFVRFTPPNDDYADELYYPPIINKKGFDDRLYVHPPPPPKPSSSLSSSLSHSNEIDLLSELSEPSQLMIAKERQRLLEKNKANEKLENRIKDIREGIALRRMLAEYEHEQLRPQSPVYINNELYPSNNIPYDALPIEPFYEFKDTYKRGGIFNEQEESIGRNNNKNNNNGEDNELPSTFFREMAKTQHIHLNPDREYTNHYRRSPLDVIIPSYRNKDSGEDETIDDNYFAMNTYPVKYPSNKILSPESSSGGVYTEGGLVYVPERNNEQAAYDRKEERRNMLADMLGFTRHERLDVKKPGPLIGPPPQEHQLNKSTEVHTTKIPERKPETKEVLPAHIKGSQTKKATRDHSGEDHAPHTVDTEYAHVYLKNP